MVTIELPESVAAALTAQAEAQGLRLNEYLERMARSTATNVSPRRSVEEFERDLDDLSRDVPSLLADEIDRLIDQEATPGPLYTGTYSREDIYFDHD